MFGNFFKPRTHYDFNYKPRYYDERKERREQLEKKYQNENNDTSEEIQRIKLTKNNLKLDWIRAKKNSADKNVAIRLAIIITILVGIIAYIFQIHTLF
ncbi:MAG: hypothetical protein Q7U08_05275 [Flavobacteriaceae bacterium]|jgi:transposase|nr:hypothetical protein [Flavobacteriaceae bacterium]